MSVIFYLIALVLAAIAVLFVVPVVLRRSPAIDESDRQQKNIEVARQRLDDLHQRESAGEITTTDANLIREEIERSLLQDVDPQDSDDQASKVHASGNAVRWAAIGIAVFIPLAAGALYLAVGEPGIVTTSSRAELAVSQQPESAPASAPTTQDFEQLTERLLTHLADNEHDVQGWLTLAQLFGAQRRFTEAAGTYKKVRELEGDSAEYLIREADAMAMANNGVLQGTPERLIEAALELDPQYTGALWLAGLAAGQRGDVNEAVAYWERAQQSTDNTEMLAELRRLIASGTAQLTATGDETEAVKNASSGATIMVKATIEPSLVDQIDPETSVFIFARAFNGPPAPLAVLKKQVKDLPATVRLDDSLAMLPNLTISAFDEVYVVARVSFSDAPQAQSGDFFGQSSPIRPGIDQELLEVVISQRVP